MNPSSPPPTGALKPDPRMKQYFSSEDQRRSLTKAMFDEAAPGYDTA
jgi:demethylmenaquinone methyltransferase/2-methoxy-6-polyprenyl-1,4-benzoquinol methylase